MKVLIFGGCGFIGSYLVDELTKRKYTVTIVDKENRTQKKSFIECDILDTNKLEKIDIEEFDFVYNMAGLADIDIASENPLDTIKLNILGNLNILNICKNRKIRRFVFASSTYALSNKGSFYGISKLSSEKLIEEYFRKYGLKYTIIRYGSVYGEKKFFNNYIYNLIEEIIKTNKIVHHGDGEEIREYIHAADAAKLSVDIIENSKYENGHVILTGFEKMRRIDLFKMIIEILNKDVKIELKNKGYINHYKRTPYSFLPEVSEKLIANPFIDIGQGILNCIKSVYGSLE